MRPFADESTVAPEMATDSSYQSRFNRFELKYLLAADEGRAFLQSIDSYLVEDPNGAQGYDVHSLYYDSSALNCYWEKIDGVKVRRKLRLRTYGELDPETGEVFLEIKERVDRIVRKRRTKVSLSRIEALLAGEDSLDDAVVGEAVHFAASYGLEPTLVVSYRRLARLGAFDPGLRITLDTQLRCRRDDLDLRHLDAPSVPITSPEFAILEIKFNEVVPLWLTVAVARFEARLRRVSKYCAAAECLQLGA